MASKSPQDWEIFKESFNHSIWLDSLENIFAISKICQLFRDCKKKQKPSLPHFFGVLQNKSLRAIDTSKYDFIVWAYFLASRRGIAAFMMKNPIPLCWFWYKALIIFYENQTTKQEILITLYSSIDVIKKNLVLFQTRKF